MILDVVGIMFEQSADKKKTKIKNKKNYRENSICFPKGIFS